MLLQSLRKTLQSNYFYIILSVIVMIFVLISTKLIDYKSKYNDGIYKGFGTIVKYSVYDTKIRMTIKADETIEATYYYDETNQIDNIKIGSKYYFEGEISTPKKNTIPNTFNYQKYLYNLEIYKTLKVSDFKLVKENKNVFLQFKNWLYEKTNINEYLKLFIIGDKSSLDNEIYNNYKDIGIAHILAISGMHVSVFILIINKILFFTSKKLRENILIFILLCYSYLVNFTPSIMRVVGMYILKIFNERLNFQINNKKLLYLWMLVLIIINPFIIYQVGFQYSFLTAFCILFIKRYLSKNYIKNTFIISFWTLIFTLPVTINLNYEINLILFISNLIFIPLISYVIYPLALIVFVVPWLLPVFQKVTFIMEKIVIILSNVEAFNIVYPKVPWLCIVLYFLFLFLFLNNRKKLYVFLLVIMMLFIKVKSKLNNFYTINFLDVGQGDSSVIISPMQKEIIMVDTGGLVSFNKNTYHISDNVILYLKSLGIKSVDYLVITHGDYDHMGEAVNLVENFKVEKVIFNNGEYNDLELELTKVLEKKKISYYQNIKELNIGDNKLYFLNDKIYDNENDNSIVLYTKINNYKLLLMGDAGVEVEKDLINKYHLENIDILKVGHHGSKTSSSEEFIDYLDPNYSIISVGKNNRYGHPNDEVLDILDDSNVYRTDKDGSIMIKFNKNKLEVNTCPP